MTTRKAYFGDVHGSLVELEKLYSMLTHYSLDAVEHCGDLVDRGPDSGGVVNFCRENNIGGVLGNHDSVLLQHHQKGRLPNNPDKRRSVESLNQDPRTWAYLETLPYYKFQPYNLLQAHAGINPYMTIEQHTIEWCMTSLVHPDKPKKTKWWGVSKEGVLESVLNQEGWVRWYEDYQRPYDMVVGHAVHSHDKALVYPFGHGPKMYALDTGAWFSGNLTALIWPDRIFVSTKLGEYRCD